MVTEVLLTKEELENDKSAAAKLTNEDFRKLINTTKERRHSDKHNDHNKNHKTPGNKRVSFATDETETDGGTTAENKSADAHSMNERKKRKMYYAKLAKEEVDRNKMLENKYRDRAKERREGENPDYQTTEEVIVGASSAGYRAVAPDARTFEGAAERRKQLIQESKYLGGDMEHTHLVKGLDYALLQKVRSELSHDKKNRQAGDFFPALTTTNPKSADGTENTADAALLTGDDMVNQTESASVDTGFTMKIDKNHTINSRHALLDKGGHDTLKIKPKTSALFTHAKKPALEKILHGKTQSSLSKQSNIQPSLDELCRALGPSVGRSIHNPLAKSICRTLFCLPVESQHQPYSQNSAKVATSVQSLSAVYELFAAPRRMAYSFPLTNVNTPSVKINSTRSSDLLMNSESFPPSNIPEIDETYYYNYPQNDESEENEELQEYSKENCEMGQSEMDAENVGNRKCQILEGPQSMALWFKYNEVPTTILRSKAECPLPDAQTNMTTNDIVVAKLTQILAYLRQGMRASSLYNTGNSTKTHKKKHYDSTTQEHAKKMSNKIDDSIYGDIGDYVAPDIKMRQTSLQKARQQQAKTASQYQLHKKGVRFAEGTKTTSQGSKTNYFAENAGFLHMGTSVAITNSPENANINIDLEQSISTLYDNENENSNVKNTSSSFENGHDEINNNRNNNKQDIYQSTMRMIQTIGQKYKIDNTNAKPGANEKDQRYMALVKETKSGGKDQLSLALASNNTYAECYPGYHDSVEAVYDSDEEVDFTKMDLGNKKGPVGRWDFDTAEEYSTYMSKKEALPKAAFQYGVKMNAGRKTRRTGPKDEKMKLDQEWNKISKIIQSRKAGPTTTNSAKTK